MERRRRRGEKVEINGSLNSRPRDNGRMTKRSNRRVIGEEGKTERYFDLTQETQIG